MLVEKQYNYSGEEVIIMLFESDGELVLQIERESLDKLDYDCVSLKGEGLRDLHNILNEFGIW